MVHSGATYDDFLQDTLLQLLKNIDLARQRLWMRQDGASPHYAQNVQNLFRSDVSQSWIERWSCKLVPQIARSDTIGFFL